MSVTAEDESSNDGVRLRLSPSHYEGGSCWNRISQSLTHLHRIIPCSSQTRQTSADSPSPVPLFWSIERLPDLSIPPYQELDRHELSSVDATMVRCFLHFWFRELVLRRPNMDAFGRPRVVAFLGLREVLMNRSGDWWIFERLCYVAFLCYDDRFVRILHLLSVVVFARFGRSGYLFTVGSFAILWHEWEEESR